MNNANIPAQMSGTSEDLISRQAAIDGMRRELFFRMNPNMQDRMIGYLNSIPSATVHDSAKDAGWIPVKDRLPEDIKPVIVTWKNNDPESYYQYIVGKHFIGTAHYFKGKWYWYSSTTEDLLGEYGRCDGEEFDEAIEVIAWQPLPEPFRPEEDDA